MRQLSIGRRLTLAFSVILLLTFIGSLIGVWQFIQLREQARRLSQINAETIAILEINNQVLTLQDELGDLLATQDAAQFAEGAHRLSAGVIQNVEAATTLLESSQANRQEARYATQLHQLADIATLPAQLDSMIELAQAGDWLAVRLRLENQVEQVSQITQNLVDDLAQIVAAEREEARQSMERSQQQALVSILITGLLTLLSAGILGFIVTRSIAQPLADLEIRTKALARREFDHPVAVSGADELARLSQVFDQAAMQLAEFYNHLEELVQKRTQELQQSTKELQHRYLQLETSIAVGRHITSILDLDTVLSQVVELIKERYGSYFVGVFLLNTGQDYIILRAGTGQAGRRLRQQGFRLKVGAEGIIGWVAQQRRLARVDDVSEDERYTYVDVIPNTRSELALPLEMGGQMLGVLDIQSDVVQGFRLDDMPVWQSLADQVAIAIQNASLYQSERSRRQLAETLYEVGQAISQTLDLSEVLNLILEHLAEIVPYDRAAILLRKGDELEFVAIRGFPQGVQSSQLRVLINEGGLFEEIYLTQQPLILPDASQHPDWQNISGLVPARSWLAVPLNRFNRVIGILSLACELPDTYSEDQAKLAVTFASQAAIALENARLYDKISRFTQQLEDMVRERTEAVQVAYLQLEQLDKVKSDFIQIAAHELRTPLTILRGYSQMLLIDPDIKENSGHLQLVSGIHSGAIRLHEIINSMLDVTKIDNRALELYPEPLAIASLIQLVYQEFAEPIAERNLTLGMENLNALPAIEADPDALPKVFHHLITNAIKYTPDGGKITITGRAVTNGPDELRSKGIELVVGDTGIGIDPEFHELIFTKFYQTGELSRHSTGKTKFRGAGPGLGLAIAKGIVEAHRGKIWVESPGHNPEICPGSNFYIFLPLRQRRPTKPLPPPSKKAELHLN